MCGLYHSALGVQAHISFIESKTMKCFEFTTFTTNHLYYPNSSCLCGKLNLLHLEQDVVQIAARNGMSCDQLSRSAVSLSLCAVTMADTCIVRLNDRM